MKKFSKVLLFSVVTVLSIFFFQSYNARAAVMSYYIDMTDPVKIYDDTSYIVTGYDSYYENFNTSTIEMFTEYNFVKVIINYKNDNIKLTYHLQVNHLGTWETVKSVSSSARTGDVIDIYTSIYRNYEYRLVIENVNDWWNNYSSTVDVKWQAIR